MIQAKEKKEKIIKLNESELRKEILIPLLAKMGFIDPIEHHHYAEKEKTLYVKNLMKNLINISILQLL